MTRLRIVILVPPALLGGRRRLFERFSDAVTHRADRLFPEAETVCRRGPALDIAVTGLPEEDADQAELILAELAAALEELLEADDSWWDEAERRKAAGAVGDDAQDRGAADADGEVGAEAGRAADAARAVGNDAGGGIEVGARGEIEDIPDDESADAVEIEDGGEDEPRDSAGGETGHDAEDKIGASGEDENGDSGGNASADDGAAREVERADASLGPASRSPGGLVDRPLGAPGGLVQAQATALDGSAIADVRDDFPPEGSLLRRSGRSWLALFPVWGVSVRLEERQDGLVGAVTRLLPGAVPSAGAWARLTGGRGRAVPWDKAPPAVMAALRAMVRPEE